jgi:hypothetical protein
MVILAANGYGYFSKHFAASLVLCCFCNTVQIVSLAFSVRELSEAWLPSAGSECCSRILEHPVNVSDEVRVGQWFALIFAVLFSCERALSARLRPSAITIDA